MIGPNVSDSLLKEKETINNLNIGQRIESGGKYGTVMYIGEIAPTKGFWLGIDWDDAARGKHNGLYNGVEYFKARYPTSGSFVRMEKLNVGKSCPEALRERYGEVTNDETAGINRQELALLQKEINARFFEVVGFDKVNKKQSDFWKLKHVCLREHHINGPGTEGDLQEMCPNIEEIDLSKNLLNSWYSVSRITTQLSKLKILNLSENSLKIPENPHSLETSFSALQHIIIGRMNYCWREVLQIANMWPQVLKLQAPFNSITVLEPPLPNVLNNLKLLDLEGNQIKNWQDVNKLGELQRLEVLNVTNCGLTSISFPIEGYAQKTSFFPALRQLHISENCIETWDSVNELNKLKNLEDLRFRDNPVLREESVETSRQLIIARIGNLKTLNGILIVAVERRGAEYDYLKKHGRAWLSHSNNPDSKNLFQIFLQQHPRYTSLVEKYGPPEESELKSQPKTLQSQLIRVEIKGPDENSKSVTKTLNSNMSVQKFAGLVQRIFGVRDNTLKLSYINESKPDFEYPIDVDYKELAYYAIGDGDQIIVRW